MSNFILFDSKTGESIQWYDSESAAREGMRLQNIAEGWTRRARSFGEGAEYEWCYNKLLNEYGHGYGIASLEIWQKNFNPLVTIRK